MNRRTKNKGNRHNVYRHAGKGKISQQMPYRLQRFSAKGIVK